MSLQVFLQAQLLGTEKFLSAPSQASRADGQDGSQTTGDDFLGRAFWLALFCEIIPRALLGDLKLSPLLLGSSSAEQFLLVLAEDDIPRAEEFLNRVQDSVEKLSGGTLRLVWVSTENLGAWPVARKRLDDALLAKISAPLAGKDALQFFSGSDQANAASHNHEYFRNFAAAIAEASRVGWSPESPAELICDGGQFSWALSGEANPNDDAIFFPRRVAMDDEGNAPASPKELAARAEGSPYWGVLRGDVDLFEARLRRAGSIEEHIHLSVLFKQFFAGELALLCSYPEFWRKVTLVYRGGDDFAVVGSWDALILMARELHRVFEKFIEQNLGSAAGVEAKTITMAVAITPDPDVCRGSVYEQAGLHLRSEKVADPGTLYLFGRSLEWARLQDAEELKTALVRLVHDCGVSREYINDIASVYRESFSARGARRAKAVKLERPWRTYMRVSEVLPQARSKEFLNLRNTITMHLLGKRTAGLKLRPSARVGLEWARLAAGE